MVGPARGSTIQGAGRDGHELDNRRGTCRHRPVRGRHFQPAHPPAQYRARRLERHRRPAPPPHRSGAEFCCKWCRAMPRTSATCSRRSRAVEGRKVMDQIDGFREYLGVAEEERLEYLNPPEKTPELFERFLPYAVALDLENSWAKRFAGILATAAAPPRRWRGMMGPVILPAIRYPSPTESAASFPTRSHRLRPHRARATAPAAAAAADRPAGWWWRPSGWSRRGRGNRGDSRETNSRTDSYLGR